MRKSFCLFLVSGIVLTAFGQKPDTLLLETAIATALEKNFEIRIAKNTLKIAENNNTLGNAGFLPVLDLGGSWDNSIQNTEQEFASGDSQTRDGASRELLAGSADLTWTIFNGLAMFASRDRLAHESLSAQLAMKSGVDNVIAQVMTLFFTVALEQERLALFASNIAFSENRVQIVNQKYELGKESKLSLLQAQVDLNADKSAMLQQQELLITRRLELLRAMGLEASGVYEVFYNLTIDTLIRLDQTLADAGAMNPALQRELVNKSILENQKQEISRGRLPELDVNLGYSYSNLESEAGFVIRNQTTGLNYGLTARWTVFDGFNRDRELQNAIVSMDNAEIVYDDLKNQLETSIRTIYTTYRNNLSLQQLERENLEVARENSSIALERFRLGASDALELREAQVNSVNAEVRYLQAGFNAKIAEIELRRLSGKISAVAQ